MTLVPATEADMALMVEAANMAVLAGLQRALW